MISSLNSETKPRVLSGINPSSKKGLHLGNYFGAVKPHVEMQKTGECFYFVANLHALNSIYDPTEVRDNTTNIFLEYIAFGIEPETTCLYVESDVEAIPYLQTIFNNVLSVAELERMHGYKDKLANSVEQSQIGFGLFSYPVLMAADILCLNPDLVPVGEDQAQHVEICRTIARRFNSRYPDHFQFKVPEALIRKEVARVRGIDGVKKMSKSLGNDIPVFASEAEIRKQIMRITTDPARIHATDPGDPAKNICFEYLQLLGFDAIKLIEMQEQYRQGTIADSKIKELLFGLFLEYFSKARAKKQELETNLDYIAQLRRSGADRVNSYTTELLQQVRVAVGV